MNQKQTIFVHQLLSILDDSLKLNRYMIETNQLGTMSEWLQESIKTLDRIEKKLDLLK